ncbi:MULTISPECIES: type II toxin-antitoxin system HicA family toxin [unclassified Archaeoglobus]|jgi:predicted RNA binding protein YcfA (HicA-like mRNA interferase family)|uniref:type II toxin-antitoxin system HicA family toxin n=1 Tax=unclassified Archaeoglobus TaxID=2643606 RepID=UPI0025C5680E|nr:MULTISPECIES: type II toxin-antitoxin system HicA family toxin [unclassified Archaeoglobus]
MSKLPKLSGNDVVKILVKKFGFEVSRQKGSHVTLAKYESGRKIVTVVPLHKELKPGTILGILKLAEISKEEFMDAIE